MNAASQAQSVGIITERKSVSCAGGGEEGRREKPERLPALRRAPRILLLSMRSGEAIFVVVDNIYSHFLYVKGCKPEITQTWRWGCLSAELGMPVCSQYTCRCLSSWRVEKYRFNRFPQLHLQISRLRVSPGLAPDVFLFLLFFQMRSVVGE